MQESETLCETILAENGRCPACLALLGDIRLTTGRITGAIAALTALCSVTPDDAAAWRRLGTALLSSSRTSDAIAALGRAIELEPDNVRAHNNLGQALLQAGDTAAAISHFERALELDPRYAAGYSNLGMAWTRAGNVAKAVEFLQHAVRIDSSLLVARLNLGAALERSGLPLRALDVYEEILQRWPDCVDAHLASGGVSLQLNRGEAALGSFESALELRPHDAAALTGRASALLYMDRPADALQSADLALQLRKDFANALAVKAAALCRLNRPAEAKRELEAALALEPAAEVWCDLAVVHQHLGDDDGAVRCLRQALTVDENNVAARSALLAAQIPAVANSEIDATAARAAFRHELDRFEFWLDPRTLTESEAWTMARQPFYYLCYQEQSNRPLLQRYRRASAARLASLIRHDHRFRGGDPVHRRFKVGFASAQICDHSVFNAITRGWLERLDRRRFETSLFHLGTRHDSATAAAVAAVDHFDGAARVTAEWAEIIARRRLDALIFPEIGIDRNTLALANLRLARRQFAAWGHPETSGLPTIDEFLSADAFEPDGAEVHYTEQLIRLPHLGVFYEPFPEDATSVGLDRLGIPDGAPLFICPGAPFKYRPADDLVWVEIARRLGRCTLAFFQHERAELSHKLQRRLTAAFLRAGLDGHNFLVFLPWMPRPAFLALMRRADVFLDSIGFSGFNTFMLAVQAHLPGVALEGRFMRGRFGSGILRRLGLPELVAATPSEYVEIAVRLAEDPGYRSRVRDLLRQNETMAYRDTGSVDALSAALLR